MVSILHTDRYNWFKFVWSVIMGVNAWCCGLLKCANYGPAPPTSVWTSEKSCRVMSSCKIENYISYKVCDLWVSVSLLFFFWLEWNYIVAYHHEDQKKYC
jgi:hypothetical protein